MRIARPRGVRSWRAMDDAGEGLAPRVDGDAPDARLGRRTRVVPFHRTERRRAPYRLFGWDRPREANLTRCSAMRQAETPSDRPNYRTGFLYTRTRVL
jgi:hypothetical protein